MPQATQAQAILMQANQLSLAELLEVTNAIVALYKQRRSFQSASVVAKLQVGTMVEWNDKFGSRSRGEITKVGVSKCHVRNVVTSTTWVIPGNMLTVSDDQTKGISLTALASQIKTSTKPLGMTAGQKAAATRRARAALMATLGAK